MNERFAQKHTLKNIDVFSSAHGGQNAGRVCRWSEFAGGFEEEKTN